MSPIFSNFLPVCLYEVLTNTISIRNSYLEDPEIPGTMNSTCISDRILPVLLDAHTAPDCAGAASAGRPPPLHSGWSVVAVGASSSAAGSG